MLADPGGTWRQNYERIGLEVYQGVVYSRATGEVEASPPCMVLRVWNVTLSDTQQMLCEFRAFCFDKPGHKQQILAFLQRLLDKADLDEGERRTVSSWRDMLQAAKSVEERE